MSFNPLIPQPAHYLSQSQGDLLSNNGQLNTVEDVNHVSFDNAIPINSLNGERGKHHMVDLLKRDTSGSAPPYAVVDFLGTITEMVFYAKDRVYGAPILITDTTLYLRKANGNLFQMSGLDPVAAQTGSTFLPGGMIMKWGKNTVAIGGTITFAQQFPANCFSVTCTPHSATTSRSLCIWNPSATGFQVFPENNGTVVTWIAIGN
jgi:hypothetical protein